MYLARLIGASKSFTNFGFSDGLLQPPQLTFRAVTVHRIDQVRHWWHSGWCAVKAKASRPAASLALLFVDGLGLRLPAAAAAVNIAVYCEYTPALRRL